MWLPAVKSPLRLYDRSFDSIKFFLSDLNLGIGHCRDIGIFKSYKNVNDNSHPHCYGIRYKSITYFLVF